MNLDKRPQDINVDSDAIDLIIGMIRFGRLEGANGPCIVAHLHDASTLGCGMTPREACRDLASKLRQLATEIDAEAGAPATPTVPLIERVEYSNGHVRCWFEDNAKCSMVWDVVKYQLQAPGTGAVLLPESVRVSEERDSIIMLSRDGYDEYDIDAIVIRRLTGIDE